MVLFTLTVNSILSFVCPLTIWQLSQHWYYLVIDSNTMWQAYWQWHYLTNLINCLLIGKAAGVCILFHTIQKAFQSLTSKPSLRKCHDFRHSFYFVSTFGDFLNCWQIVVQQRLQKYICLNSIALKLKVSATINARLFKSFTLTKKLFSTF